MKEHNIFFEHAASAEMHAPTKESSLDIATSNVREIWNRLRPYISRLSIAKHVDNILDEVDGIFEANTDAKRVYAELRSVLLRISQQEKKILYGDSNVIVQELLALLMTTAGRNGAVFAKEAFRELDREWSREFEFQEAIIMSRLEVMLEEYAEYLNEGDNAVIFKIDLQTMPDAQVESFRDIAPDYEQGEENAAAVKILKFYRHGAAAQELHTHNNWFQMVEAHPDREGMAWVPRPADSFNIAIREQAVRIPSGASAGQREQIETSNRESAERVGRLIKKGFPYSFESAHKTDQGSSARVVEGELFIMDYIDGKDLATVMLDWIINHPPEGKEGMVVKRRNMSRQDRRRLVMDLLDLNFDESEAPPHMLRQHLAQVEYYTQQAIHKHLKATGFKVNPHIISQIEKTAAAARSAGLFHRDAHEGNVLLTGDFLADGDARAYVIDFGENTDSEIKELEGIVALLKSFQ